MSMLISSDRSVTCYRNAVMRNFEFFKRTTQCDDLYAKSLRLADGAGFLLPTCDLHVDDDALIADLTRWRNEDVAAYPSQFVATPVSTKAWLRDRVLAAPDRMLFLVVNKFGRIVGHMGFASAINDDGSLEMDNIVRGVKSGSPGIMARGMMTLIDWAEEKLGPREIYLRVFETNTHAIAFYEKLGFVRDRLLPLTKHPRWAANVNYKPTTVDEKPDTHFVRMTYRPRPLAWQGDKMILTAGPTISARETSYALDAVRYGWNDQWNKYLRKFEQGFAEYVGVKHALAFSSCTGALHVSLLALGIGKGDEVIVPELTWVATANAELYTGATPIFADVEEDTWCLDADSVAAKITPRTKAVMPVHLYGQPCRMDRIMAVAKGAQSLRCRRRRSIDRGGVPGPAHRLLRAVRLLQLSGGETARHRRRRHVVDERQRLVSAGIQDMGSRPRAGLVLDRLQRLEVQDVERAGGGRSGPARTGRRTRRG